METKQIGCIVCPGCNNKINRATRVRVSFVQIAVIDKRTQTNEFENPSEESVQTYCELCAYPLDDHLQKLQELEERVYGNKPAPSIEP